MKPKALILRSAGANCDLETAYAFEQAGALSVPLHLNRLLENPAALRDFQILAIPGGFSYGDDIAAGKILAKQLSHHLYEPLRDFVAAGKPIIGICNGFQVLVKSGLLPGAAAGVSQQNCTLTDNASGRFTDRWVHLATRSTKCIWTHGLESFELPIAHGEGRFATVNDAVREALWQDDRVALVYVKPDGSDANGAFPDNPNGSVDDIAGVCDESGIVFGLMPHPERYVDPTQHYARAGVIQEASKGRLFGELIFLNSVVHARTAVGTGV